MKKFNVADILAGATQAPTKKNGSTVPVIDVPSTIQKKATRLHELKKVVDTATTELNLVSAEIVEAVEPIREALIMKQGYMTSVKLNDTEGDPLTISWTAKYSKVPMEMKDTFDDLLGQKADELFTNKVEIKVKDVSETTLKELITLVGPQNFAKFFEVAQWMEPTEKYTKEVFNLPPSTRETLKTLVKQAKPSVKA